jgi:ABC-type nickel/cobalt efflux system permease component RcnA
MRALQCILAFSLLYGLYRWREAPVIATAIGITMNLLWQVGLFYAVRKEKQRLAETAQD